MPRLHDWILANISQIDDVIPLVVKMRQLSPQKQRCKMILFLFTFDIFEAWHGHQISEVIHIQFISEASQKRKSNYYVYFYISLMSFTSFFLCDGYLKKTFLFFRKRQPHFIPKRTRGGLLRYLTFSNIKLTSYPVAKTPTHQPPMISLWSSLISGHILLQNNNINNKTSVIVYDSGALIQLLYFVWHLTYGRLAMHGVGP